MTDPFSIELIAPSGFPPEHALARGIERLRSAGHEVRNAQAGQRRFQRFAGTVAERVAEINRLADPSHPLPDLVMAVRGGYGVHQVLASLDYEGLRARFGSAPCPIVGHSDISALSMALLARAGVPSVAGPMLAYDFGGDTMSEFTQRAFWALMAGESGPARWHSGTEAMACEGVLWGGNLAVLCALLGTPYLPQVDGGILFVEDIAEPAFRIERLLMQLHLAGVLGRQRALILGDFAGMRADAYDPAYDLDVVAARIAEVAGIPVVRGLPFGHCPDKLSLPIGVTAQLSVDEAGLACLGFASPWSARPTQTT
ncbi:LD-carboxypeptidase [Oleiagrimonas sp. C23AA]|uniref:LD-carboxypeptidase n=1 Tax=Oleiagrimonas sp. C23AA TaxID=2719047 RepID=UPI00141DF54D|nr:LD-carboxypeptidase [Oleiagrimonas sp. C23AA]NII12054.1 muramoyltetrapeptide carboxypeptidase [Oleiagrimonas sp. C23AA]